MNTEMGRLITVHPPSLVALLVFTMTAGLAAAFFGVYWKLGRRIVDLVFAGVLADTALYAFSEFMLENADDAMTTLHWTRMIYIAAAVGCALVFHFAFEFMGVHDRATRWKIAASYAISAGFVAATFTPWFFTPRIEPTGTKSWRNVAPYIPEVGWLQYGFMVFCAAVFIYVTAQLQRASALAAHEGGPLREVSPLRNSFFMVMLMGSADFVLTLYGIVTVPLALLGIMGIALPAAMGLGREVLTAEMERERLKRALRVRDSAVRDVAHEVKGALTPIEMAASMLHTKPEHYADPETRQELLSIVVEECQRLTRLINNLLDKARLEAGRPVEVRFERVDLCALIQSVLEAQRLRADKHQLELACPPEVGEVEVDADKMHQVLVNLLDNAIKYSPEGGRVVVSVQTDDGDVLVSVSDPGIGMTSAQQERLFKAFGRVVNPERGIVGTGIGLHLIKQLIEAHGGTLWVESEYGRGSTFTFRLPRHRASSKSEQRETVLTS